MRKRTTERTAMTLTELVIAAILIGFLLIGIVSIDYAIRNAKITASKEGLLVLSLQAAMVDITHAAMSISGEPPTDIGIVKVGAPNTNLNGVCFRHDTDLTPGSYDNDEWTCYTHGHSLDLYKCTGLKKPLTHQHCVTKRSKATYFGQILELENSDFYDLVYDADNRLEYIEFTFTSVTDRAEPRNDPIRNPEHTIKTRVSPPSLSR